MTSGLETFAKVRALHDRTTNPGEKASAAARMKTLAGKAGMTVDQAVSKLDAPPVTIAASRTVNMADFFDTPYFREQMAERERARVTEAAAIVARYGSADAVFADTPMEAALRAACEPLLGPGETWNTIYRLDGWGGLDSRADMPASVREAVTHAWPMPETISAAWTEFQDTDRLIGERYTLDRYCDPHSFSEARRYLVEGILNTAPALSLNDMRARGAWLDFWANGDLRQGDAEHQAVIAALRADIERMGRRIREQDAGAPNGSDLSHAGTVHPGQQGEAQCAHPSPSPDRTPAEFSAEGGSVSRPPCEATVRNGAEGYPRCGCPLHASDLRREPAPVQSGHAEGGGASPPPLRRTNADKRRDVLALLDIGKSDNAPLADREIARRAGVSPTTVGTIRRSLA